MMLVVFFLRPSTLYRNDKLGTLACRGAPVEQMMAKENQAVTLELTRLGAERDDDRRKLGDALHQQGTAAQVQQLQLQRLPTKCVRI